MALHLIASVLATNILNSLRIIFVGFKPLFSWRFRTKINKRTNMWVLIYSRATSHMISFPLKHLRLLKVKSIFEFFFFCRNYLIIWEEEEFCFVIYQNADFKKNSSFFCRLLKDVICTTHHLNIDITYRCHCSCQVDK